MTLKHSRPRAEFHGESESALIFSVQPSSGEILSFFHPVPSREAAADDLDVSDVSPIMALPILYQKCVAACRFPSDRLSAIRVENSGAK